VLALKRVGEINKQQNNKLSINGAFVSFVIHLQIKLPILLT